MTKTCAEIQPMLSQFVDGDLSGAAAGDVRQHLAECDTCRGLVTDLERLRAAAGQLGPMAPPSHIWLEVAGQIRLDGARAPQPAHATPPRGAARQWIGIAAALVLVTTALYLVRLAGGAQGPSAPGADNASSAEHVETLDSMADEVKLASAPAERAIADLEAMAAKPPSDFDPAVATVFKENLGKIDATIAESRSALASNPESESARDSLFEAMRHKISVLQTMVSLINDMRLGDEQGAARTAESLGKKPS